MMSHHLTYDSFGNITSQTSGTHDPLFAFTGRDWDADAELYYYRLRWYDPAVGEFIGEDPSGFAAGDTNLDRYVGNAPTNYTDPFGLEATTTFGTSGTGAALYPDWYAPWIESMRLNSGDGVSFESMGDWGYYHVYDTAEWFWQNEEYIGTVRFDRTNPDDYDIAMQVARQMEMGVGLGDIREHVDAGVTATELTIRMANQPLDFALSTGEFYKDPGVWTLLAMVPYVPGKIPKVLQTGGNTLKPATVKALGLEPERAQRLMEKMKQHHLQPSNYHHHKIYDNGDVWDTNYDKFLDNLFNYQ